MNGRPNIPPIAPLLFIGLAVLALKAVFSSAAEKKPETAPAAPERKPLPVPPNSAGNGFNPPYSAGKISAPLPAAVPANSALAMPKIPVAPPPIIPAAEIQPEITLPTRKKFITRADMAKIFNGGTLGLTRMSAVFALKALGFGKTAAYAALSPDGRFSAWLQCAPDGIITWKS
jgi:hypothetical protein